MRISCGAECTVPSAHSLSLNEYSEKLTRNVISLKNPHMDGLIFVSNGPEFGCDMNDFIHNGKEG